MLPSKVREIFVDSSCCIGFMTHGSNNLRLVLSLKVA